MGMIEVGTEQKLRCSGRSRSRDGDADALVELAGLLGWGRSAVGTVRCPRQGKAGQSRVAAVGSIGFEVTTSLCI